MGSLGGPGNWVGRGPKGPKNSRAPAKLKGLKIPKEPRGSPSEVLDSVKEVPGPSGCGPA